MSLKASIPSCLVIVALIASRASSAVGPSTQIDLQALVVSCLQISASHCQNKVSCTNRGSRQNSDLDLLDQDFFGYGTTELRDGDESLASLFLDRYSHLRALHLLEKLSAAP